MNIHKVKWVEGRWWFRKDVEAIILYSNTIVASYMQVRVETRSGYLGCPGHVLTWLRGFHPLYKISRSDLHPALDHVY